MSDNKTAVIISVGTELTKGRTQEKHLKFLAPQLRLMGFEVIKAVTIPDNADIMSNEIKNAVDTCTLLIITGGLGPTSDDITREIVASVSGDELVFREDVWISIQNRFHGRKIAAVNKRQAMFPGKFNILENRAGTAPGMVGWIGNTFTAVLPGPPRELKIVFDDSLVPVLEKIFNFKFADNSLTCSAFMTPESALEESLEKNKIGEVTWGTRVSGDHIEFYLKGGEEKERQKMFANIKADLGEVIIRRGDTTPVEELSRALRHGRRKLVTAESCTGGLLGKLVTDIPGSSEIYWGGYVTYSNIAKQDVLNIPASLIKQYGAVSAEVCEKMSRSALENSTADISIGVSGIAGPEGGTKDKPVGTVWVSVLIKNGNCETKLFHFSGSRSSIRMKTAVSSFLLAEKMLIGNVWLDRYQSW